MPYSSAVRTQFILIVGCLLSACTTLRGPGGLPKARADEFDSDITRDRTCYMETDAPAKAQVEAKCRELGQRKYYHGVWIVGFEANGFTFVGQPECYEPGQKNICLSLRGDALVWPPGACPRRIEIEFVGRRYLHPVAGPWEIFPEYAVIVEKVISRRRLADPTGPGSCEPNSR